MRTTHKDKCFSPGTTIAGRRAVPGTTIAGRRAVPPLGPQIQIYKVTNAHPERNQPEQAWYGSQSI